MLLNLVAVSQEIEFATESSIAMVIILLFSELSCFLSKNIILGLEIGFQDFGDRSKFSVNH